jgi:hypothetical protein
MGSIFKFAPIHCTPRLMWAMKNVDGAQELADQGKLLFGTTDTWILWNLTGIINYYFFLNVYIYIFLKTRGQGSRNGLLQRERDGIIRHVRTRMESTALRRRRPSLQHFSRGKNK